VPLELPDRLQHGVQQLFGGPGRLAAPPQPGDKLPLAGDARPGVSEIPFGLGEVFGRVHG
jgi:hypothetical protein